MKSLEHYKIDQDCVSIEMTEKGSKFIAFILKVNDESQIKQQWVKIKTQHPKANHWCSAWKLGMDENTYRYNDDGESSGTAGKPLLNQIERNHLTNVLLVVVRYFGGVLLVTSGLIKAYKSAGKKCIEQCTLIKIELMSTYQIKGNHATIQTLIGILKELNIAIQQINIMNNPKIIFDVPSLQEDNIFRRIKSKLEKITGMNPRVSSGPKFRPKERGIKPSALSLKRHKLAGLFDLLFLLPIRLAKIESHK